MQEVVAGFSAVSYTHLDVYKRQNVLFFTRGTTEQDNTTEVAFYDMRTNMDSFGKTRQLRKSDFDEFVAGYEEMCIRDRKYEKRR